ncbi:hypothetical protein DFJ58DRAFT_729144 [Suillus subalutaceus]|uniref:uncharacterized protein n=1 Tax=Suillus subalutaceus TaxID=48586 RepID=UPI001B864FC0|nr:uncharacterized protein DFJ58DRAFT_729144 [Suillus subalutaceus]KAG1850853.1 hypothetical protein DFJ58DRAFT_729144 [Suillus subalutaceus]
MDSAWTVRWLLQQTYIGVSERYELPIYVTENGFAIKDEHSKSIEEALQDNDRMNYFKSITASIKAAVLEHGVDVRAYFPWRGRRHDPGKKRKTTKRRTADPANAEPIYGSSMPPPATAAWPMSAPSSAYLYQPETLGYEFSVLTGFLETLDEGSFFTTSPAVTPSLMPTPTFSQPTSWISNAASAAEATSNPPAHPPEAPAEEPAPLLLPSATKAEIFLLTAADQESGTRDERLSRVIRSKHEAGLLKPDDYVKGYARLSRWMDRNVSRPLKQQILQPLSVLRPKFRAVAQSLRDIDLVFIEEAFERLLLDYDRVFSAIGVPACLWRRTGEIYKGNREFSELVGFMSSMQGRLCIYELMAEGSAVNYWEKYGHVAFDSSQTYLDLDIPVNIFQHALDLRPTGHPDRPITQLHLAMALLPRFVKRGFQMDADEAEELLNEVLDAATPTATFTDQFCLQSKHPPCIWLDALLQLILGRSALWHPYFRCRQINSPIKQSGVCQIHDIPKIDIDITKLTPLLHEVISKQVRNQLSFICGSSSTAFLLSYNYLGVTHWESPKTRFWFDTWEFRVWLLTPPTSVPTPLPAVGPPVNPHLQLLQMLLQKHSPPAPPSQDSRAPPTPPVPSTLPAPTLPAQTPGPATTTGYFDLSVPRASSPLDEHVDAVSSPPHSDTVPMTRQDMDHTKNLVLDLLGWGVSPEYLVKAGVSAGVLYRVFTDINFHLPTNLVLPPTRPLTPSGIRYELHEFQSTDFALARLTFVCVVATVSRSKDLLMSMDAESLSGTTSPSNLERQWTASPAVTPSLMPTPTFSQAIPYISSPASATEATSNPPAHPPSAPTEELVHVSGTRCVSNLLFRCWGADQVALKFAIHLCANSTLLRIVDRFHDDIFSDLNSPTRYCLALDPGSVFRCTLLPFLVSYSRLVVYSFGFQHAFNETWRRVTMSSLTRSVLTLPGKKIKSLDYTFPDDRSILLLPSERVVSSSIRASKLGRRNGVVANCVSD